MGNGEAKELICMTYGHEQRRGRILMGWGYKVEEDKGERKMGQL